ncbi:hypothetical protein TPHA_0D04440 [Tetrapisispora phaffii CBS 4417]|uniref:Rho-GAP domain-containing protein n=1 Tax=Tetrapisispora phaffii (strain ATCC 24235 / CBS 4417 / NBRC 1672 / NRRL Y-8282 / UCD 70-5) TaxID=1071381 RepID=G8BS03_TETPH|nr:hypothetical protein TPHA_0D04440 [Tetrapisispora phaffii CBS 4417]CCE63078.1 hypothetical protein TPHA_0D04440 [Tetrapisispora phaffii CBS 4417]
MIDVNVNNIFFKSYSVDPNTGHSIYVFDSTYLPSPEEIGDKQVFDLLIDELMDTLIAKLPAAPYSIVVFSSGFSKKKISWVYGIKMYSKLPNESRKYLQKTYIVHESFYIRTVYQVLSNAMNFKFLGSSSSSNSNNSDNNLLNNDDKNSIPAESVDTSAYLVHVPNLTALSHLIDITRLRISLNVYLHDYDISEYIDVPDEYFGRMTTIGTKQYKQLIFDKIFKRLRVESVANELVFQKPGSYKKVNILLDIIERSNYIDLSQWDIYSLASVFFNFLKNKSKPLIPIDLMTLPISDDFDYTYSTFMKIIEFNNYYDLLVAIIPLFLSVLDAHETTKHDSRSLSKALAPTLCKERISMNSSSRMAIGIRFIKNLLEHFDDIRHKIDSSRVGRTSRTKSDTYSTAPITSPMAKQNGKVTQQNAGKAIPTNISNGQTNPPPLLPKPRKMSPSKYDNNVYANRTPSRDHSPTRSSSIIQPPSIVSKTRGSSTDSLSLSLGVNNNIPNLPPRVASVSVRINSDSLASESQSSINTISSNNTNNSMKKQESEELVASPLPPESIKEMVQESPSNEDNEEINKILKGASKLTLENNAKILTFDREMKKKKQKEQKSNASTAAKFSSGGYSGIKTGNKVSKLAALYEERLQGIQVMNELQKQMNNA